MRSENACAKSKLTYLYRAMLKQKCQKPIETLPGLGESLRRLVHLACPCAPYEVTEMSAPCEVIEMIAKDQSVDALAGFDMKLRIQQSGPKSLNEARLLVAEIETFCRTERQRHDIS